MINEFETMSQENRKVKSGVMTVAVIAVSSVGAAEQAPTYEQFLSKIKDDIDVDAITLSVLQNMQSENQQA